MRLVEVHRDVLAGRGDRERVPQEYVDITVVVAREAQRREVRDRTGLRDALEEAAGSSALPCLGPYQGADSIAASVDQSTSSVTRSRIAWTSPRPNASYSAFDRLDVLFSAQLFGSFLILRPISPAGVRAAAVSTRSSQLDGRDGVDIIAPSSAACRPPPAIRGLDRRSWRPSRAARDRPSPAGRRGRPGPRERPRANVQTDPSITVVSTVFARTVVKVSDWEDDRCPAVFVAVTCNSWSG